MSSDKNNKINFKLKSLLTLLLLFGHLLTIGQNVTWGVALSQTKTSEIDFFSLHGNSIVWGAAEFSGMLVSTNTEQKHEVGYYGLNSSLIGLDLEGKYKWTISFDQSATLHAVDHASTGKLMAVLKVEGQDENDKGEYVGNLFSDKEPVLEGYYIVIIAENGQVEETIYVENLNLEEIEVHQIRYFNGSYLLCGEVSEGPVSMDIPAASSGMAGGDFLLSLNATGTVNWVKVVSYAGTSCCSRAIEKVQIELDNEGNIYLAGSYQIGAIFGPKSRSLAPISYAMQKKGRRSFESYVASYSEQGEIRWVQTSKNQGRATALAVDNKNVYFAHRPVGSYAFGQKIDLVDTVPSMIVCFSKNQGKLQWQKAYMFNNIRSMIVDAKGELVVVGVKPKMIFKEMQYQKTTIKKTEYTLVLNLNTKGKIERIRPLGMSIERNSQGLIQGDDQGAIYVCAEQWCGLKMLLNMWDKNLPEVECYGGIPFLAKLKE